LLLCVLDPVGLLLPLPSFPTRRSSDLAGNFWFSSHRGIGRIALADIDALDRGQVQTVAPRWYGTADGMLNAQGNGASQTPAGRTADGRLWFGTAQGGVLGGSEERRVGRGGTYGGTRP